MRKMISRNLWRKPGAPGHAVNEGEYVAPCRDLSQGPRRHRTRGGAELMHCPCLTLGAQCHCLLKGILGRPMGA